MATPAGRRARSPSPSGRAARGPAAPLQTMRKSTCAARTDLPAAHAREQCRAGGHPIRKVETQSLLLQSRKQSCERTRAKHARAVDDEPLRQRRADRDEQPCDQSGPAGCCLLGLRLLGVSRDRHSHNRYIQAYITIVRLSTHFVFQLISRTKCRGWASQPQPDPQVPLNPVRGRSCRTPDIRVGHLAGRFCPASAPESHRKFILINALREHLAIPLSLASVMHSYS